MHLPAWHSRLRAFGDHEIPQEELEALSRKYSSATILLLPLSSGRVALFDNAREFRQIADAAELDHPTLSRLSREWEADLRASALHAERLREMHCAEPALRTQARDLRSGAGAAPLPPLPVLDLESV